MIKYECPKCKERENLHYNYVYGKQHRPIKNVVCNECGSIFDGNVKVAELKVKYDKAVGYTHYMEKVDKAPAIESVPAPGEPASELHRVRSAKLEHIKAQNYQIAALYREIEKLLTEKIDGSNSQE